MNPTFFDLETQYLFNDVGGRYPEKLKVAIAGILENDQIHFFQENQVQELFVTLNHAKLIVGHNLFGFDYLVIQPYLKQDVINMLKSKTFDMMVEIDKVANCWTSLDDLGKRNIGMEKTIDTVKIPKMWRDGQHQEVKKYLINDLKMTEAIFNHGKTVRNFKYMHKDYGKIIGEKVVKVNW